MNESQVVNLMESSKTEDEWSANADKVKKECDGYPDFWFSAIVLSGLMGRVTSSFGSDDKIHISRW